MTAYPAALDKNLNIAFLGTAAEVGEFLNRCRRAGFTVTANVVSAARRDIELELRNGRCSQMSDRDARKRERDALGG